MNLEKLRDAVLKCMEKLHSGVVFGHDDIILERPKSREHGDWSTNVAMKFAKKLGYSNPRELASMLVKELESLREVQKVEIAGPGFINISLDTAAAASIVKDILAEGEDYGRNNSIPERINLEFVSANPTGPLHIGGVRWAAVGDSLARILEFSGSKVTKEYYFNDHGTQIDRFAKSLFAAANHEPTPEDGYAGSYISEIASRIVEKLGKSATLDDFRSAGVEIMFPAIKQSLKDFGVEFDVFFHEQSLYDEGKVNAAIEKLRARGAIYEENGATWVRTTDFGDDKDRVVIKSNGEEAYFAADIAYYLDKRARCDKAIYMLGADHGGYVGRLYAVARAFGDSHPENIEVLLGQLVNLKQGGEPVRMSKRAGNIITIDDLVDVVGVDAARYSLTRSSTDSTLELDLDLLSSNKMDNPVFYVQYAFARTQNVLRHFEVAGFSVENTADLGQLTAPEEEQLLATLTQYPAVIQKSATLLEPHRVCRYLEELASSYHSWYAKCRVVGDGISPELSAARIQLNLAAAQVLKNGLKLVGVSAPEKM
ncbi:MAG: arginine--tRNA ligase [Candidatus Ancillula sp.]|jgi:arginyl-tRNA synthetase|nr:arginine--tRNA ligase [Candidatus Ancillula sp.]